MGSQSGQPLVVPSHKYFRYVLRQYGLESISVVSSSFFGILPCLEDVVSSHFHEEEDKSY